MKRNRICFLLIVLSGLLASCKKEPPVSPNEVKAIHREKLPVTVEDKVWNEAPVHAARLILQDLVEPRLIKPSTLQVHVQTITDGRLIAFRLQWEDSTTNNLPATAQFTDACAIQLPLKAEADLPAPQMGEEGRPVEITYWSASWQASVEGRADDIRAIYPGAAVDHYPFQAPAMRPGSPDQTAMEKRYSPAKALGNAMAVPRKQPVQDLIAEGPGTLRPADRSVSTGSGKRIEKGWSVLIARPLPESLAANARSQVAFAIWEGSKQEVGSRKMRTAWIPLILEHQK